MNMLARPATNSETTRTHHSSSMKREGPSSYREIPNLHDVAVLSGVGESEGPSEVYFAALKNALRTYQSPSRIRGSISIA